LGATCQAKLRNLVGLAKKPSRGRLDTTDADVDVDLSLNQDTVEVFPLVNSVILN
jgi:hypothetical protein